MREAQGIGMKELPVDIIFSSRKAIFFRISIRLIAEYRMSEVSEVDPDLVGATRFYITLDEAISIVDSLLEYVVVSNRFLSAFIDPYFCFILRISDS